MTDRFCSRAGCTKKLNRNNTTGMCATNCEADGAPQKSTASASSSASVMKRFRTVATALGKDPNAILEEAAQAWLDVVAKAVE
jgi:hypothetical protein